MNPLATPPSADSLAMEFQASGHKSVFPLGNSGRSSEQLFHCAHQHVHALRLIYMRCVLACALDWGVTAIAHVRNATRLQSLTKRGAVTVAERMIHDGGRQPVVLNQDKRVTNGSCHCGVGAGAFQRLDNIHCNENLVFDYEDRAPSERGMFHVGPMRG
jgi:hypothetical protein